MSNENYNNDNHTNNENDQNTNTSKYLKENIDLNNGVNNLKTDETDKQPKDFTNNRYNNDRKELNDYDNRNYTYNNSGTADPYKYRLPSDQFGAPEGQSADKGYGLSQEVNSNPAGYSGYTVKTGGDDHLPGGSPYNKLPEQRNESRNRGLLGTLSMVLIGAVLGSGITLASGNYFFNNNGSVLRNTNSVTANQAASTNTATSRSIITAPPADTGVTPENLVAEKVTPSVVGITTETTVQQPSFFGGGSGIIEGVGSGVIVSEDGYIVTNSHVVDNGDAKNIKVVFSDESSVDGKVLWSDAALDLAIVKVNKTGLTPVEIGSSDRIKVGDKAIAIGNPLGLDLQSTLTSGYISGLDRSITLQSGGTMSGLIQTDAAINEGNSGGALLNAAGQLIGINTAKAGGGTSGIGFAIPIDTAKIIIEKVMTSGSFDSVYLGVTGMNVAAVKAQKADLNFSGDDGVYIIEVMSGTAASSAGLQANDIITAIDDHAVTGMTDLKKALLNYQVGDTVTVTYYRNNSQKTTQLKFAQDSSNIQQFTKPESTQTQP